MLDFRIHTFLSVCEHMSFTKAAHELHLTQPAVSHHMHALQELYGQELFTIVGRQIVLTDAGNRFRTFAQSLQLDVNRFIKEFSKVSEIEVVKFGATLTIGEFTLPPIIRKLMQSNPKRKLTMHVDNTENLLAMIDSGNDSHGSQLFITTRPDPTLKARYAAFGRCVEVDVVRKISNGEKVPSPDGKPSSMPRDPVKIFSVKISRGD